MALNPITALSEQLQKLINEHGSAAILRDHLALFKDQVVLLEKENSELTAKAQVLQSEKEQLTKDNEKLRSKIQEYEQSSHKTPIDDPKVKILAFLSDNEASTADEVAYGLDLKLQLVRYHLEELYQSHMVDQEHNPLGSNWWSLKQPGRKYLIESGILA